MLRPRASLQATNVRLCREVHTFAHVEPFPARHVFRPRDVVHLYMELANYTSVPDGRGGYTIELSSSLELRDGAQRRRLAGRPEGRPGPGVHAAAGLLPGLSAGRPERPAGDVHAGGEDDRPADRPRGPEDARGPDRVEVTGIGVGVESAERRSVTGGEP